MRLFVLVVGLLFLSACMPSGPTGNAIAPPMSLSDGHLLVRAEVMPLRFGVAPVKITVSDDIVYRTVLVDGEVYELLGDGRGGEWLSGVGTVVVWLRPGEHVVHAFSCEDGLAGWRCGCVSGDDCGHWMERSVLVVDGLGRE